MTTYEYDPEKAKALLAEAGYANGFDMPYLVPASGSGMVAPKEIATAMQADLAKVGVNAQIETMEWISYIAAVLTGLDDINGKQFGMCQMSWMNPVADPGLYVEYVSAGQGDALGLNLSYYDERGVQQAAGGRPGIRRSGRAGRALQAGAADLRRRRAVALHVPLELRHRGPPQCRGDHPQPEPERAASGGSDQG